MRIAVVGGGFFGCCIAEFLGRRGAQVELFEREGALLTRASYNNQARLHGGYHYPRSFATAVRSRLNMPGFFQDFRDAIETNFVKLYAIARRNSKVTARQFAAFCASVEAPLWPADARQLALFRPELIEAVYRTEEFAFDAAVLRRILETRLTVGLVQVHLGSRVTEVLDTGSRLVVIDQTGRGYEADWVVNSAYAGLNSIRGLPHTRHELKHEISELALIELPSALSGISITVMDGPFFSIMPFPDRKLSTLSHVRYTPHLSWVDNGDRIDPYGKLELYAGRTRFGFMIRDAGRFIPEVGGARYCSSLFEVKTVLVKNELDDGRPILFEWAADRPRLVSVLGSKLDNIYDIVAALEAHIRAH